MEDDEISTEERLAQVLKTSRDTFVTIKSRAIPGLYEELQKSTDNESLRSVWDLAIKLAENLELVARCNLQKDKQIESMNQLVPKYMFDEDRVRGFHEEEPTSEDWGALALKLEASLDSNRQTGAIIKLYIITFPRKKRCKFFREGGPKNRAPKGGFSDQ